MGIWRGICGNRNRKPFKNKQHTKTHTNENKWALFWRGICGTTAGNLWEFGGEFVGLRRGICGNTGRKPSAMAGEIALKRKKEKRKKKGPKTNKKCGPKAEQIIFKFMANWWKSSKCILNLIYIRNEKDKNAIKKGTQKPCLS